MELATLKNNNARLTNALQESTANVEEWKRQLQAYKEENQRVKSRIVELEAGRGPPLIEGGVSGAELKREVASLRLKIDSLEAEIRLKDDEIRRLNAELRDLTLAGDKIKVPLPTLSFFVSLRLMIFRASEKKTDALLFPLEEMLTKSRRIQSRYFKKKVS